MSGLLAGKAALVTGAAGGIGTAVVRRFLADGARVFAIDRDERQLAKLGSEFPAIGTLDINLSDQDAMPRVLDAFAAKFGQVDILVNNAGIGGPRTLSLHELPLADYDEVMDVNLRVPLRMTQAVLVGMLAQGRGAIVNLASPAGFHAVPNLSAYSISKAGLVMLTKSTAKEYAAKGIRCNAVAPGVTQTAILEGLPQMALDQIVAMIPQGRMAQPHEIAGMIAFLASDQASYVNGSIVFADGAAGT